MIDPMIGRIFGCFTFAGMIGALLLVVAEPRRAPSDMVAAAEIQHRVDAALIARP